MNQNLKEFTGIIASVIYALLVRVLAEFNIIEVNSISFLLILPTVISGYLPFYFGGKTFAKSIIKIIFYPLSAVILFFMIAIIKNFEDIGYFVIIGIPFFIVSIMVSLMIRYIVLQRKDNFINKNSLVVLTLPVILGIIEKKIEKRSYKNEIQHTVIINQPKDLIWKNLYNVPDLSQNTNKNFFNFIGIPAPQKSVYNSKTNERTGYFENGIYFLETVSEAVYLEKLSFKIDIDKSNFKSNKTIEHVLTNRDFSFNEISYELKEVGTNKTAVTLKCNYILKSNIPFYSELWAKNIVNDFETKLLSALKITLENSQTQND